MLTPNILLLLQAADAALALVQKYQASVAQAVAEGRDVSDTELDGLVADDDAARAALVAEIAKRR